MSEVTFSKTHQPIMNFSLSLEQVELLTNVCMAYTPNKFDEKTTEFASGLATCLSEGREDLIKMYEDAERPKISLVDDHE